MGHFGRVLDTPQPSGEPREADATTPIFQISMVCRVWRLPNSRSQIQILLSLLLGTLYRRDFPGGGGGLVV